MDVNDCEKADDICLSLVSLLQCIKNQETPSPEWIKILGFKKSTCFTGIYKNINTRQYGVHASSDEWCPGEFNMGLYPTFTECLIMISYKYARLWKLSD